MLVLLVASCPAWSHPQCSRSPVVAELLPAWGAVDAAARYWGRGLWNWCGL